VFIRVHSWLVLVFVQSSAFRQSALPLEMLGDEAGRFFADERRELFDARFGDALD
jgi:hypothetical protein